MNLKKPEVGVGGAGVSRTYQQPQVLEEASGSAEGAAAASGGHHPGDANKKANSCLRLHP